jgi:putative Holliday junction resolvase
MERPLPLSGRLLGLDAGERRVGIAISDPEQRLALPLHAVDRAVSLEDLADLARVEEIAGVVVGLPVSLSGDEGAQAQSAREFAREVEKALDLPVAFWDERLTSQEAERTLALTGRRGTQDSRKRGTPTGRKGRQTEKGATDVVAATIILQAFLDSRHRA